MPEGVALTESGRVHAHQGTVLVCAARQLGVDVEQSDIDYIRGCSLLAAAVDDMIDVRGISPDIAAIIDDPATGLEGIFTPDQEATITSVIDGLSDERRAVWLRAEELVEFAARKKFARTVGELATVISHEADLFADVFSFPETGHDTEARKNFNQWLGHFAKGGYYVDGAVDMTKDYELGEIQVEPTVRHRSVLLHAAFGEFKSVLAISRSPRVVWELGKTSLATVREGNRGVGVV